MSEVMIGRRETLTGIVGLGLAGLPAEAHAAQDAPDFAVPDGACDCHLHIYDPRFPYLPNAQLRPVNAAVSDYKREVQTRLRTTRAIAVTPSTYGTNNRCLIDALKQFGDAARGIAVIRPEISDAELKDLDSSGVRGVRLNLPKEELVALSHRLHALNWNMEFYISADRLVEMEGVLLSLPTPIVLDHLAHAPNGGLNSPAYRTARKLLDAGRCWMKCSGAYIDSKSGPPDYADSSEVAKSFIAAAQERCVWATNWPFPDISAGLNPVPRPDALPFFNLFGRWAPDAALRHRLLVDNPERLYGFAPEARPKAP